MRILLVFPSAPTSHSGNQITATRWAGILRALHHEVALAHPHDAWPDPPPDLLIALHARKSAAAVRAARRQARPVPVILALTGTDLYPDLRTSGADPDLLDAADALVVLQHRGLDQLPTALRERTHVIVQSATADKSAPLDAAGTRGGTRTFNIAMLAHLRPVKDPGTAWQAMRLLPNSSRARLRHAGGELDPELGGRAREETRRNPRYTWLGELRHGESMQLLQHSRLLVVPSRNEGGANVISEALALRIPVLATRIPGSVGILADDYPGYFPVGDPDALAQLIQRCEATTDGLYRKLQDACADRRWLVMPDHELDAWRRLLGSAVRQAPR